ncbi:hypothetical protein C6V83_02795 [Gordonia iterans]|uniref:Uncharacterized protein n=1 Tax=Gordonia iterans TaxID=1004901 RepID=A0A2S0KCI8_9ACTN|nr:hypothetical protein [Gordonia iterans]AVL99373.1 hypothetical protein C6V83_02795 [Gordonia iterans]
MTYPGTWGDPDDSEHIPTQAELDAEDLAELERSSRDADLAARYPRRPEDPGPPPTALTRDALICWYVAALAALACIVYGFATLGAAVDRLADRLEPQMAEVHQIDGTRTAESMAAFWPPALIAGWLVAIAITYPLLVAIGRHHSRNVRSIYAAVCILTVMFVPLISDLLFDYPEVPSVFRVAAWVSVAGLLLSVLMTFRGSVGGWLPASTRLKPSKVFRNPR